MQRSGLVGVVLGCLLVVAGCGGSGGHASSPRSTRTSSSSHPTDQPGSIASVNSCSYVTSSLLNQTFGTTFTAGRSSPSILGDSTATNCAFSAGTDSVSVEATTMPDKYFVAPYVIAQTGPGTEPIPGADRGTAFVSTTGGKSIGDILLVKGNVGFNISISLQQTFTHAPLLTLCHAILAKLATANQASS